MSKRPASTSTPRLPADVYQSMGQFRRAMREFLAFSEAAARGQGLTAQQHQALLAIKAHAGPEPITVSALADDLLIKTHSAVGLITRLVDRGLVRRRASETDRRRVQLSLTPKGEAALAVISRANLEELTGVASILTALLQSALKLERETDEAAVRPRPASALSASTTPAPR